MARTGGRARVEESFPATAVANSWSAASRWTTRAAATSGYGRPTHACGVV
ncbi:hypothetical protein [Streptomyces sp. NPDC005538]